MKIAFKDKRLIINLILGIVWIIVGVSYFLEGESTRFGPYFTIVLGAAYLWMSAYEYYNQYLTITGEEIQINTFPKKRMTIREITEAGYYADDFTFRTPGKTLKVRKSQISARDLPKFEAFFNDLKLKLNTADIG